MTVITNVAIFIGTVISGLVLYSATASASQSASAFFGVLRNVFMLALGAVSIIYAGGPLGILGGVIFTGMAVYFGSGHYDNLTGGTLRQRLS